MADRVGEIGAVEGVEMELVDAAGVKLATLLGGDRGGDELAGARIAVEPLEEPREPGRDAGAAALRELHDAPVIGDGEDSRDDRDGDAGPARALDKAPIDVDVEEELGDRARGAGVDLALEIVEIERGVPRLGMGL